MTSELVAQRLCGALTGVDDVSVRFAGAAIAEAESRFGGRVDALIDAFERGGLDAVRQGDHLGIARGITFFLYTGKFPDADGRPDPSRTSMNEDDYFESLVWRVVQAHPRALSGGYFGHWHYPPEDDDGRD